ncbi:MAG: permease [Clostridiales bacterium]|nr:permease [Candidatus Crickella merdequi]
MYVLKGLCVVGLILNVVLVVSQCKKNLQTEEGQAAWAFGKKHVVYNTIVGILANFFDTLGIGSYAPTSAAFKFGKSVEDINIPGTLNVGDTFPVLMEAFLFFGFVDIDIVTLALMLIAAVAGAFLGAGFVTKLDVQGVRLAMFIGLALLGIIMLCRQLGVGPFGITGEALKLTGVKLIIGVVMNFILGALMCIGVGLYAPCIALVSVLGMNVGAAFPIMMGSCAFLMAFGNGPKFVKENRFDMVASLTQMFGGAIGVLIAYYLVKSLPLTTLLYIVIRVVEITAIMFLMDYLKGKKAA